MGTRIKERIFEHDGFSSGDRVSHSKIGSCVGSIVFFAEFSDGVYALVDYGKRKRLEKLQDLVPLRSDIYVRNTLEEDDGIR